MDRRRLIKKYITNFDELGIGTQKELVKDLKVFSDSIFISLVKKNARVIILPLNKELTGIKEYSHLKGKPFHIKGYGKHEFYKTFDEVRGWGGNPAVIGEEWVLAEDKNIFNVVRHEIAHQIQEKILPRNIRDKTHVAYLNAKKDKRFIRKNSSINVGEYFADGVTFFFNESPSKKIRVFDMNKICNKKLLFKKDIMLYNIISDIF